MADQIKETSNADFASDTDSSDGELRQYIEDRRTFLLNHAAVDHVPPTILSADLKDGAVPLAGQATPIDIQIGEGPTVEEVSVYYTSQRDGQYTKVAASPVSEHAYRAEIPSFLAGTTIYFYAEAQASDTAGTLSFLPRKAEGAPMSFQIGLEWAQSTPVVINELMAKNETTLSDATGEFDDWIELFNRSNTTVDLSGMFLIQRIRVDGCFLRKPLSIQGNT